MICNITMILLLPLCDIYSTSPIKISKTRLNAAPGCTIVRLMSTLTKVGNMMALCDGGGGGGGGEQANGEEHHMIL